MTMSDPIADMLTRIRNANTAKHDTVDVPASKMKLAIADILVKEGYIAKYEVLEDGAFKTIRITLKYGADKNEKIITGLKRISKPGLRIYAGSQEIPRVLGGLGIAILSTNQGVITDKEARKLHVGGEVSKPGLRIYAGSQEIPRVLGGLGIAILSTNQGVITDKEARKLHVGGEVLAFVW